MVFMSTPTPADLMRRRPAGTPGGGRFVEKVNTAPVGTLAAARTGETVDFPMPSLVDEYPAWVADADAKYRAEYRALWKRLNARHRGNAYGDAVYLSESSDDHAVLAVLSQLAIDDVAERVARNANTPPAVLHMIAVGESDWRNPAARRAAVLHPDCPEETIRIVWAHRRTLDYQGMAKDVLTTAPNIPDDLLEEAALEGDPTAAARLLGEHEGDQP